MSPTVLVDTSCWVEYFNRPDGGLAGRVRTLIQRDHAAITGVILAELLQGSRTTGEVSELRAALEAVAWLETSRRIYTRAGTMGFELRRRGKTVPVTDCVIAAVAESAGASVLTLDGHFEEISQVSSLELEAH